MPHGLGNDGKKMEPSEGQVKNDSVSGSGSNNCTSSGSTSKVKVKKASSFRNFTNSIKSLGRIRKPKPEVESNGDTATVDNDDHQQQHKENGVKRRNSLFRRPSWRRFTNRISRFVSANSSVSVS